MLSKIKTKLGNFKETTRRSKYAHYYKDYDIEDNIILYDSYFSRGMLCNPYAISENYFQILNLTNTLMYGLLMTV